MRPKAEQPGARPPARPDDRFGAGFAAVYGLFLGLAIWKFGNPVILDRKVSAPVSLSEFWSNPWPPHWANLALIPLALAVLYSSLRRAPRARPQALLGWLPLAWLGWQAISAGRSVDPQLSTATLWQFGGCVLAYFAGWFLLNDRRALNLLLAGVLLAFTGCLVRAVVQRQYEFPQSRQLLLAGEASGWTNFPPATLDSMAEEQILLVTNGITVANPAILAKFAGGRVNGTLVYPNALAGLILLLWPVALVLAFQSTRNLRPNIRRAVILLTLGLGGAVLFWTGSKLGWLLGTGGLGLCLLRQNWPARVKYALMLTMAVGCLGLFAVRFHHYFAAGATSVTARLDYWRAAIQTTVESPVLGSGPGTFQHPYARLKPPAAEMARLTHNDYLEQFSDSGVPGGVIYATWICLALARIAKKIWRQTDIPPGRQVGGFEFALFLGVLIWFLQGFGEFSLYIPALAWIAFTLLGSLTGLQPIAFDKKSARG